GRTLSQYWRLSPLGRQGRRWKTSRHPCPTRALSSTEQAMLRSNRGRRPCLGAHLARCLHEVAQAGLGLGVAAGLQAAVGVDPQPLRAHHRAGAAQLLGDLLRSEEHTSELQSRFDLVCRLLLEKKKNKISA